MLLIIALGVWWQWFRLERGAPLQDVVPISLTVPPAPKPSHIVRFNDGCVRPECHASLASSAAIHEPVARGFCQECHAPDAGGHTFPLLRERDALCDPCHQIGGGSLFQHRAMSEDGCLACHDPHSSAGTSLLVRSTVEETCERCHPPTRGPHPHEPYARGQCQVCHEPHGADGSALLRALDHGLITAFEAESAHVNGQSAPVMRQCRACHADVASRMAQAVYSHQEIDGACLACHAAHAGEWRALQKSEPRQGCIACHEEVGHIVERALISHDAVLKNDECVTCHDPHASNSPMMLRDDHVQICLRCHSEPQIAADGRQIPEMASAITSKPHVHGPVAAGNCAACHSVHGAQHEHLLKQLNPAVLGGAFDVRNYALCFNCHDQSLALAESGGVTEFRNGDVNLHRVHLLSGERSRSCAACHDVHSSSGPRLISETVAYDGSSWNMPMGFFLTPDGGGCAPGCHEPLRYSREEVQ